MNRQIDKPVIHLTDESSNLKRDVLDYQKLAGYHMKLALIMRKHNQSKACLILCDWALTAMIKALYIHENQTTILPDEWTMNEILPLVHTGQNPGLDIVLFIGTMQYMSLIENGPDSFAEPINLDKLLERTEQVLSELTVRILSETNSPPI
ncbi:hypothetical protein P5G61_23240 [Paenibacillus sp. F6_3S_P_1C]|uniref:Uncharacterized protein n=2 Tax=Paenibacillus vandeheii TaxID=3035917 RepID=A0ABT8JGI1_9BACL|nr:hypothetical protein [Paenibacillus vandeheii]